MYRFTALLVQILHRRDNVARRCIRRLDERLTDLHSAIRDTVLGITGHEIFQLHIDRTGAAPHMRRDLIEDYDASLRTLIWPPRGCTC